MPRREPNHQSFLRRKIIAHTVHGMHPKQIVAPAPRAIDPVLTAPQGPLPAGLSARTDGPVTITGVRK